MGVWHTLSLVIRRKITPLSCTLCASRDGGDHQQQCTRPPRALAGHEKANEPSSGPLGQLGHLDVPHKCMECDQMTRVVGAAKWPSDEAVRLPRSPGLRGLEDKDRDEAPTPGQPSHLDMP
ncbi:hypothetical protein NDU88_000885 [Pleurodeles waltl]|uniref:Uncharacterized protein n=1 Tax=Pleurodeles waltl TaxID=8319 RepID=A0AAV7U4Q8_PLEWA|nr:hypothetical protein NDU88_000885 [Pleurodeles waltl]